MNTRAVLPQIDSLGFPEEDILSVEVEPMIFYYRLNESEYKMASLKFHSVPGGESSIITLIRRDGKSYDQAIASMNELVAKGGERLYSKVIIQIRGAGQRFIYVFSRVGVRT